MNNSVKQILDQRFLTIGFSILLSCCAMPPVEHCLADETDSALRLTLPAEFHAVPGLEMSVYFDNILLTEQTEQYRYQVTCAIGKTESKRWSVIPKASAVGRHRLTVSVTDKQGDELAQGTTTVRVVPAKAGAERSIRLLIVGDSLTHATLYPNEIARLLSVPGNPRWKMLGTHKPSRAARGVAHEGYGGWTWRRFTSGYEPNPDGTHRKRSSPFVFLNQQNRPALDLPRYLKQECDGQPPDFIIVMLGINDCFSADADDPAAIDARIDAMLKQAEILLKAFRQAAPKADIGICLTTPPNAREAAFETNYKGRYSRWGWKRIQHRLVGRQIEHFQGRAAERLHLIPTQLNLDPLDGYPENNGVHPNERGYRQIGATIYSWLKARLDADSR